MASPRALVLVAAVLIATAGCGLNSSPSTSPSGTASAPAQGVDQQLAAQVPQDVRQAGVLRVATDPSYPPFESTATDGKTVVGLDPDLAKAVGQVLDLRVEFVPTSFDAIIPALAAKRVDMPMSSIGDTKEREKTVDFATYYWNGSLLLVGKGNPKQLQADLACGAKIGVIRGSLQQTTFLPQQSKACEAAGKTAPEAGVFQNGSQAQLALQSNRIDGLLEDAPPALDAAAKDGAKFETAGPLVRNPNPGGVAFPKGSGLVQPVNGALNRLIQNGSYAEVLKTWKLDAISVDTSEVNGARS